MGWKLNLCLAAVGAYLLGYRPAPFTAGLQSVASLGYTFVLPSARTPPDGLTSAIRNVTSDYDQARRLKSHYHHATMLQTTSAGFISQRTVLIPLCAPAHAAGQAVLHRAL